MTEKELDEMIFKGTKYDGLDFVRESEWSEYDCINYASPVFKFENGDRVVIGKDGTIIILK